MLYKIKMGDKLIHECAELKEAITEIKKLMYEFPHNVFDIYVNDIPRFTSDDFE